MAAKLRDQQAALAKSILKGHDQIPRDWLALPEGSDPDERVAAYVDGYPARISESLKECFPATSHILGQERLSELVARYIAGLTETPRNLNEIGRDLPQHLSDDPLSEDLPFLPDLATFEWAISACFHAEQREPFDAASSADWSMDDWEDARIHFQQSMCLVRSDWPLRELRDARDVAREEIDIDLTRTPRSFLVRRDGFNVVSDPIDETEADAIAGFLAGDSLGEVMTLLEERGSGADEVVAYFAGWSSLGLVVSCGPHPSPGREH